MGWLSPGRREVAREITDFAPRELPSRVARLYDLPDMLASRCLLVVVGLSGVAHAGSLTGKLELPPAPERPRVATKGFLDRVDNQLTEINQVNMATGLVVVLEGDEKPTSGGLQVTWELAGDSFGKPVLAVPVGAEVVIKNTSRTARMLVAAEDPKLIPGGPINAGGPKSFRPLEAKTYTIGDSAAPHLKGKLVVVNTRYVASVDDTGKFEIADVAAGAYKLRVYVFSPVVGKDGWLEMPEVSVTVPAKGKGEAAAKLPAGYPVKGK
jgi:hypothetical protein